MERRAGVAMAPCTVVLLAACLASTISEAKQVKSDKKPHIVVILADDLGWNEVSWHNPGFLTPRMEALSSAGVRLDQSYVTPKCSPSRAALLSGRYPWRLGLQRGAIERWQDTGLDTGMDLLPGLLGQGGYRTHLVRQGMCSRGQG